MPLSGLEAMSAERRTAGLGDALIPAASFWSARVTLLAALDTEPFCVDASEPTMVDVDEDRLKLASGPRCVSLSSARW